MTEKNFFEATRTALIQLFGELGFKNSDTWKMPKMLGRVKVLPETPDIEEKKEDVTDKKFFSELFKAVEAGTNIIITNDKNKDKDKKRDSKLKKKATKKTTTKKTTTKKTTTKKKESKKKATSSEPAKRKPTDKSRIYAMWYGASKQDASTAESLIKKVKAKVKLTTVKSWISGWKNDRGVPATVD